MQFFIMQYAAPVSLAKSQCLLTRYFVRSAMPLPFLVEESGLTPNSNC